LASNYNPSQSASAENPRLISARRFSPLIVILISVAAVLVALLGVTVLVIGFWMGSYMFKPGNVSRSSPAEDKAAVKEALTALGKIKASTQVGVNFQQYSELLIEAKAKANEATSKHADPYLIRELNASMEAYNDAAKVWSIKIRGEGRLFLYESSEPGKTLIPKYSIPAVSVANGESRVYGIDSSLQIIWKEAEKTP
jgi:hypothetical protein